MSDNGLWDEHAQWWLDGFTNGVDPEYVEQIIPLALEELAGRHIVLDVGCGDGQIARALSAQGSEVLGIDPTQLHIDIARERAGGPTYEVGSATRLPVADNSQDAVVACLVFEHIDKVDAAIAEVARVLKQGGQ
ncbi:MAG: class I SAM-dependent methyltransferase, partial [Actinomycetes bacterium]